MPALGASLWGMDRALLGLGGLWLHPRSCGFALLPPMAGLGRFGELCAWGSQKNQVPSAVRGRAKPFLVREPRHPTTFQASFVQEFALCWLWFDADCISGCIWL